jgi:hypothetical protein
MNAPPGSDDAPPAATGRGVRAETAADGAIVNDGTAARNGPVHALAALREAINIRRHRHALELAAGGPRTATPCTCGPVMPGSTPPGTCTVCSGWRSIYRASETALGIRTLDRAAGALHGVADDVRVGRVDQGRVKATRGRVAAATKVLRRLPAVGGAA